MVKQWCNTQNYETLNFFEKYGTMEKNNIVQITKKLWNFGLK